MTDAFNANYDAWHRYKVQPKALSFTCSVSDDAEIRPLLRKLRRETLMSRSTSTKTRMSGRALALDVKNNEHGQFIQEPTARLLKEKEASVAPYLAGALSDELFKHLVYGKEGSPQNLKAQAMKRDAKNFIEVMKKVKPKVCFLHRCCQ